MKRKIGGGLFLILFAGILHIYSQDGGFILTAASTRGVGNIYRATVKIDNAELNKNPDAVIIVKQISGANHPIGVWYLNGYWHVVNRDQSPMAEGNQYQITFWKKPDAMRFVHVVNSAKNLKPNGTSLIDHPALNNRPNASWDVTQSTAGYGNPNMVKGEYDPASKKWLLLNDNGTPLLNLNQYNIAVYNSGTPDIAQPDPGNLTLKPGTDTSVLESNSATSTTGIKTFFRTDPAINSFPFPKDVKTNALPTLEQTITVNKKSRLIIDASILVGSLANQSSGALRLKINGRVENLSHTAFTLLPSTSMTVSINSFMTDVNPGTYQIEFEIISAGSNSFQSLPVRSSIIQIPIE